MVDDGSTDRTADIAAGYSQKHAGKLRVLKLERNLGKGEGRGMEVISLLGTNLTVLLILLMLFI